MPASGRACSTSCRSVGNVSSATASWTGNKRTVLELVVVVVEAAADRLHQEEVDGLVDALAVLGEEVVDRSDRREDAHLEARLLDDLAERGLLDRLGAVRRPLGQRPAYAVAVAPAHAQAQLGIAVDGADHDAAARGGAGRAPPPISVWSVCAGQPRHGAALRDRGWWTVLSAGRDQVKLSLRRRITARRDGVGDSSGRTPPRDALTASCRAERVDQAGRVPAARVPPRSAGRACGAGRGALRDSRRQARQIG